MAKFIFIAYDADVVDFRTRLTDLQIPFTESDQDDATSVFTMAPETDAQTESAMKIVEEIAEAEIKATEDAIAEYNRKHPLRPIYS